MVQTRASAPSGRVYTSSIPPRQRQLRDIMKPPQKSRRRVSAGPVPSLKQETLTQIRYVYRTDDDDLDAENQPPYEEEEDEADRIQRERRKKRRRTLGDSPANGDPLSRKKQSTLTQIGFVEPVIWKDPDLEEADEEGERYARREGSIPIWEDETVEPETGTRREGLRSMLLPPRRRDDTRRPNDRAVGDSDEEEDDAEIEDNLGLEDRDDEMDGMRDATSTVPGVESTVVREEEEIGDSDEESDNEDLEQHGSDQNNQYYPELPKIRSPLPAQVQVRSSIGPPVTPRKRRYEIPDSDAESEDISPEKTTPLKAVLSQSVQSTPSRRTPKSQNRPEANTATIASKSPNSKAPVTFSQATTVDLSQYTRSQGIPTQKTPSGKTSHQDPTNTSPFVLRSSQLLTESQLLPASLMGTVPLPPRWIDSDEEDGVDNGIQQGNDENDDEEDDDEL